MTSWNRTRPESASCRESPPLVLRCMTLTLKPRPPPPPPQPGMVQANAQGRENVKWCRVVQHGVAHLQENLPLHLQQACYFWMFLGDCTGILVPGVYENVEAILWDVIVDRCGQNWETGQTGAQRHALVQALRAFGWVVSVRRFLLVRDI